MAWTVFFFPPLLNKHQTAIRLAWQYHLDFDNHWFPAAYPPFTKDIFTIILPREKKKLHALNLQTLTDSRRKVFVCIFICLCMQEEGSAAMKCNLGNQWHSGMSMMQSNCCNSCSKGEKNFRKVILQEESQQLKRSKSLERIASQLGVKLNKAWIENYWLWPLAAAALQADSWPVFVIRELYVVSRRRRRCQVHPSPRRIIQAEKYLLKTFIFQVSRTYKFYFKVLWNNSMRKLSKHNSVFFFGNSRQCHILLFRICH